MQRPGRISGLALALIFTAVAIAFVSVNAADDTSCESISSEEIIVCDDILEHWAGNDVESLFGESLTDEYVERDPETGQEIIVQYFEFARLEFHPELANTDYAVQSGRLGAELLAADGVDWSEQAGGSDSDGDAFEATGFAIAPEFQDYWDENGAELGDKGVSFRESLALHGYPISAPEEREDDEETVLVQWFERTRLELSSDGQVSAAPVGADATTSSDRLSIRAGREISTKLAEIAEVHDAPGLGVWLQSSRVGNLEWSIGYANPEANEPYTRETHHRIGSITKPFVSELALQLVDEGLIDLNDTVDEWFPDFPYADQITVKMLGNMTSGIFNYTESMAWMSTMLDDPGRVTAPEDLLDYGFDLTDGIEPGEEWSYSNTNYIMLGLIIEEVTGNDLADELESRVFVPLGLESTAFADSENPELPEPHARATTHMGLGSPARDASDWNPSWAWAAGQIYSTPADVLRWLPDVYQSSLLSDEMRDERLDLIDMRPDDLEDELDATDDLPADVIGYGFGVLMTNGWYGHDGLISGYASMAAYHPELDASLVVFSNSDDIGPENTLATGQAFVTIREIIEREYPESRP